MQVVAEGVVPDQQGDIYVEIAHGGHYEVKVSDCQY